MVQRRWPLGVTLAVCALILALRRPDMVQTPQFWAEDGTLFFSQAHSHGAGALLVPAAGYFHTLLRVIAWVVAWFDPVLAPALYVLAAAACTLYVAARTQSKRFPLPPSVGYALALVLVPDAAEVLLTLTNLQWIFAGALLLLLISHEPVTRAQRVHDFVSVVLLGLTGPFVLVLLPLFAWRAFRRHTRFSVILAGLAAACAVVQATAIAFTALETAPSEVAQPLLLAIPGIRVGASLFTGGVVTGKMGLPIGIAFTLVTMVAVAVLGFVRGPARTERQWLAAAFVLLLIVALFRFRYFLPDVLHGAGSRYFFPLQLIVLWLTIAAACRARRKIRGARGMAARISLGIFAVANVPRWREPALVDYNWPAYAARLRQGLPVTVRVNPDWEFQVKPTRNWAAFSPPPAVTETDVINLSTRCQVTPSQPGIVGFALGEGRSRRLLIRAIGPSLARFGVANPLARPSISLTASGVEVPVLLPDTPQAQVEIAAATAKCQAFALLPDAGDVVALVTLGPGVYTLTVNTASDEGGEALVEVYAIPVPPVP